MKLFFIGHDDEEDYNMDLIVVANDVDEAVDLWRTYFKDHYQDDPPDKFIWRFPRQAFEVPLPVSGEPRALAWHGAVPEVPIPKKEAAVALGLVKDE